MNVNLSDNIIPVKYNDFNRRVLIDPKDFTAAGVNTTTNAITIVDHGYVTGQKFFILLLLSLKD